MEVVVAATRVHAGAGGKNFLRSLLLASCVGVRRSDGGCAAVWMRSSDNGPAGTSGIFGKQIGVANVVDGATSLLLPSPIFRLCVLA